MAYSQLVSIIASVYAYVCSVLYGTSIAVLSFIRVYT